MKLATINRDGGHFPGAELGDEILDFVLAADLITGSENIPASVVAIISDEEALASARSIIEQANGMIDSLRETGALRPATAVNLAAPIPNPVTVLSHGQAYHSHVAEMKKGLEHTRKQHPPAGFLKSSSSVTGPGTAIKLPRIAPDKVDYEGELCVVFSRDCFDVKREEAMDYVAGYTIINDVSARNWIPKMRDPETSSMSLYHALNLSYKSFPTFCPMGPNLTTKDEIPDPSALRLTTRLNGEVMQDAGLHELIWDIAELIEYYSSMQLFRAGDLMSTGTPGGVGVGRNPQVFMKAGDVIEISVPGVGTLSNRIEA